MYLPRKQLFNRVAFEQQLVTNPPSISPYKNALEHGKAFLKEHYLKGGWAADLASTHAWLADELILLAWQQHLYLLPSKANISLIAVGGYGRSELHPYSDIDLLILLGGNQYKVVQEFVEAMVRFLWDIGMEVGQSMRSIKDCVKEAKQDVTVMTNLLESRAIIDEGNLLKDLDAKLRNGHVWVPTKFFEAKMEEQSQRHAHYNETAYNLEPNLKEGPGGLRDLHMIGWVFNRRYGIRNFAELNEQHFINDDEYRALMRSRNVLWKMRNGLHFLNGRHEDRLLFDYQRALATEYGYKDEQSRLAVEQLMQRYYRTVKEISFQNGLLLELYRANAVKEKRKQPTITKLNRRFQITNGSLEVCNKNVFKKTPFALLEVFYLMQQHSDIKDISPDTSRLIRANIGEINRSFRKDLANQSLFMEILRHKNGQTHAMRRMNSYGVLGAYIPAFGTIVGQMQHDLFHVYTVDAHTLMVLRNIRRFALEKDAEEFPQAIRIMKSLVKPERLYIGALFHDIAKGRGGDHSELGQQDTLDFCARHGLSEYDGKIAAWLVRHHLLMSFIAQRRDISDPEVIRQFAETMGDQEHLDNLYLLTLADIRGTSPKVWNGWKGQLLLDLYHVTTRALRSGVGQPIELEKRVESAQSSALEFVDQKALPLEAVNQFWGSMQGDYFTRYAPEYLAWHVLTIAKRTAGDMPIVAVRHHDQLEANIFLIYAPDTQDLFVNVSRSFERCNLNIVDARLHSSSDGFALHSFVALTEDTKNTSDERYLKRIQFRLREAIKHPEQNPISCVTPRSLKQFTIEPEVIFTQNNADYTTMELVARDHPGLLHKVAICLLEHKMKMINARIATFGERAEDVFFITDHNGRAISAEKQLNQLAAAMCAGIKRKRRRSSSNKKIKG